MPTAKKFKVLKKSIALNTKYRRVDKWQVRMPDESLRDFYFGIEKDIVVMFALTKTGQVVLNDQFDLYTGKRALELPAGYIDAGSALAAAKRELLEETGYQAERWVKLGTARMGRWSSNKVTYFLALNAWQAASQNLEEAEDIKIRLVARNELIKMLRSGQIKYNLAIACMYRAFDKLSAL